MTESTMDPSMWRERAQRVEAEVERLRVELAVQSESDNRLLDQAADLLLAAEDRLRKVAELADEWERDYPSTRPEVVRALRAALAAPPAEGSKIPSSRIGEAARSAPEAAETTGEASRWLPSEDCSVCHGEDVQCSACRPAPVSSGEAATGEADPRRDTFAEVSRAMNRIADVWERDGSDPCRVRVTREYANAYRLYAEGLGEPTGSKREEPSHD